MDNLAELAKTIAATAEVIGTQVSGNAVAVMAEDLAGYPLPDVMQALKRVRRECNRFTLAEVVKRLPNGWPGAEEAWASFPKDERETGVVTPEASQAWGVACPLWEDGDKIGARMAFKDAYERLVANADQHMPRWTVTLGWSPEGRADPIRRGIECGKLKHDDVQHLLPAPMGDTGPIVALLTGKTVEPMPQNSMARQRLQELREQLERNAEDAQEAKERKAQEIYAERQRLEDRSRAIGQAMDEYKAKLEDGESEREAKQRLKERIGKIDTGDAA